MTFRGVALLKEALDKVMRDKLLQDMIQMADQLAKELARRVGTSAEDESARKQLKIWNAMRQGMGAPHSPSDRPVGEAFGVAAVNNDVTSSPRKHLH